MVYESMLERRKWDQRQCSYCGEKNTQFVCWRCFQDTQRELAETIRGEMNGEIELLKERIRVLEGDLQQRKREERGY